MGTQSEWKRLKKTAMELKPIPKQTRTPQLTLIYCSDFGSDFFLWRSRDNLLKQKVQKLKTFQAREMPRKVEYSVSNEHETDESITL